MGYKNVCLQCRRVENLGTNLLAFRTGKCPECSHQMVFVDHAFRPPRRTDTTSWKIAAFLISKGFIFQHIYHEGRLNDGEAAKNGYVAYPKTMQEAEEFVECYKEQAIELQATIDEVSYTIS